MSKLPPLVILLLHLGACSEAVAWAGKQEISEKALTSCPRSDWHEWIASSLRVTQYSPWATWLGAAKTALLGYGYGYGYGYGDGYGDGDGYGSGYGYGDGYGSGYGYGYGYGYGDGDGYGDGKQDLVRELS